MTRLMSKSIENPINELDRAADYIRGGNLNFEVMGSNYDEIDKLCNNFDTMRRELKKSAGKRAVYEEGTQYAACEYIS